MTAMKRVTLEQLETRAFITHKLIEVDDKLGIAILKVGRETFYASLPATPGWVAS